MICQSYHTFKNDFTCDIRRIVGNTITTLHIAFALVTICVEVLFLLYRNLPQCTTAHSGSTQPLRG
jgi:hypothetical protein